MELKDKTAVITGASSGIGRAAAIEFARRGAHVVIAARRADKLASVVEECKRFNVRAAAVAADVTKPEDCGRLISEAGQVDILVNNAGFAVFDPVESANPADVEGMIRTNYLGAVHCVQAVLPQMLNRRSGTIVNVASIVGLMGYSRMSAYCASKFALVGFTEAIRDELMPRGVRVALVCPGTTETEFFVKADRHKMPGGSKLMPSVSAERVARMVADAAESAPYRRTMPLIGTLFIRFKEFSPRFAHAMFRRVSAMLEPR